MADQFHLNIITPEKTVFDGQIESLVAPGELGYLGVLAHHAPIVTTLVPGKITFRTRPGKTTSLNSKGRGFLEVSKDNAILILDSTED